MPDSTPGATEALATSLRGILGRLHRRLREQASLGDLTWPHILVLSRLDKEGPATVTALARAEKMRPQSMGATIAALDAAGMLSSAPDPADGRQTLWSITEACRDWIAAGRAARQDWLVTALDAQFTMAEQAELARAVALLTRLGDA